MHELTAEWVEKAENDYRTAVVVLEEIAEPIVDTACFHCQQCAEKYLKAFLTEHQIEFPR
jgi:HEPN domain-containing protein